MRAPESIAPANRNMNGSALSSAQAWSDAVDPDDCVIELSDVSVSYGSFQAIKGISLRVPKGATGLVGRNGAGKSTLMRVLLGLVRPTSGGGRVLQTDILGPGETLRRAVGYMPENDAFVLGMRGLEQVALAGELCGLTRRDAIRRAHEVLMYVGLGEARYRTAEQYSTGMRQRLKLAVALVHDPELLLLDEPTVGLDPPGRQRMLDLLEDLTTRHGKSLVISTHLLGDIEHTCETVVMIESGRLLAAGTLADIVGGQNVHYRLRWSGDGQEFLLSLRRDGGNILADENAPVRVASDARVGEIRIAMPAGYESRRLFELARESGVCLRTLELDHADLTELYHKLLDEGMPRES
ncbi:MAG: ABC transporter ATP-binding protein [Planctomycetota bacterium]